MDKSITPSGPVTEGQIGKLCSNITARLTKKKNELPSGTFQQVLGDDTLIDEIYTAIRKRVDAISDCIIRTVKVNRKRTPKEVLKATGRTQYVTDSVVAKMPTGEGDEVDVVFFKLGRFVSDNDLENEYALRGLIPADPYSLAAVNEADPAFADEHPNGTHWKDKDDKWCFAAFDRWYDERDVLVNRNGSDWLDDWWFAGLRKSTPQSDT